LKIMILLAAGMCAPMAKEGAETRTEDDEARERKAARCA
jgi:hypothetical protein